MSDPEAAARITEKPTLPPATRSSRPARILAATVPVPAIKSVTVPRGSPGVEDAEQVVIQDDLADTQRSEPVRDLLSKVGGLFARHRDQTQCRPRGAS